MSHTVGLLIFYFDQTATEPCWVFVKYLRSNIPKIMHNLKNTDFYYDHSFPVCHLFLTVPISVLLFQPTPTPKSVLKGLRSFEDWLLGGWSTGSNLCPCLDRTSTVGFVGDQYRPKRGLRAISHISSCLSLRTRSLKVEIEGIGSLPG